MTLIGSALVTLWKSFAGTLMMLSFQNGSTNGETATKAKPRAKQTSAAT
jgi:hypothetical protein